MHKNAHLKEIRAILTRESGLKGELLEEMIDHYASMIEDKGASDESFKMVLARIMEKGNIENLRKMNTHFKIIHFSNSIHMKIILLISGLMIFSVYQTHIAFDYPSQEEAALQKHIKDFLEPPSLWPVSAASEISSDFGNKLHPVLKESRFHKGIDIPAESGTNVVSSADGKVIAVGYDEGYGNYILIRHDSTYASKYAQLSEISVEVGRLVTKGDVIGKVGSTGKSTGPHLHFEILREGKHVNPSLYVKA